LRLLHLLDKVLHDPLVKVLPSQMCISMGSQDFKRTIINVQEGDICEKMRDCSNPDVE